MDRLDFAKSITYDDFENTIRNFFDQTMALYNLIGARDDIDISTITSDKSIEFIILTDSKKEAEQLYSSIENRHIHIYGKDYIPELRNGIKNTLHIALVDEDKKAAN